MTPHAKHFIIMILLTERLAFYAMYGKYRTVRNTAQAEIEGACCIKPIFLKNSRAMRGSRVIYFEKSLCSDILNM
jgi:hypothetical protein